MPWMIDDFPKLCAFGTDIRGMQINSSRSLQTDQHLYPQPLSRQLPLNGTPAETSRGDEPRFYMNASQDCDYRILIVDDEGPICKLIQMFLEPSGYRCQTAGSAAQAREELSKQAYHLVLSDINMPGESGLDFIRDVLQDFPETAAIMVSAISDANLARSMLDIGVYDYIIKPLDKNNVRISVANALKRLELEIANRNLRLDLERKVDLRTQSLKQSMAKLERAMRGIVQAMAHTVETRDPYTAGHMRRVADLAGAIAAKLGFSDRQKEAVHVAAIVHDLGKIRIPAEILSKPGRLTANEFNLIKEHPQAGFNIIKEIEFPWDVATIVRQHHEKLDGSGYPSGLSGGHILPEARVLTVADVVEAMASHRPYRQGLGIDAALQEINGNKGKYYAPEIVAACEDVFKNGAFAFG